MAEHIRMPCLPSCQRSKRGAPCIRCKDEWTGTFSRRTTFTVSNAFRKMHGLVLTPHRQRRRLTTTKAA